MASACSKCGNTKHIPGAQYCIVCGAALPAGPPAPARPPVAPAGARLPVSSSPMLVVSGSGRRYRLNPHSETLIGSRGCAIMLSDPRIAPQHARVSPSGGGFVIEDLGGGTLVNGASIAGSVPLQPGDTVTVGTTNLVYQGSATPAGPTPAAVLPPAPRPAVVVPPPPPPARAVSFQPGVLADGPVQTVDPERQDTPPSDPARALVMLSVGLTMLGFFAGVALASAMLWIVLLVVGLGGLGCIFPMLLSLIASIFRPILGQLSGRQTVSIINFQMLDSSSGAPVDVMVVRKRGGGGNVRLGDKVRVWGKRQASTGLIRAHRVEIYESGGHPANQALEGDKPWPIWIGLGALGFAIFVIVNSCSSLGS